ncbi:MAG: class I SAM-dependent DNA methyltransferase, partial [Thermoanaerobaculia bacterium]
EPLRERIRDLGEQLDAHRKRQQELHPELTITGMYNVLEKLRSGEALTAKEKKIHEQGLVSVLKQIHDELDASVFDAYGWPHDLSDEEILERLVALNAERAEEERRGIVRWLRPEFQNPAGAAAPAQAEMAIEVEAAVEGTAAPKKRELPPWPKELRDQVAAVRDLVTSDGRSPKTWSAEDVARTFKGSRRADVASVLDALGALGIVVAFGTGAERRWKASEG